jgi:hypothetical protein
MDVGDRVPTVGALSDAGSGYRETKSRRFRRRQEQVFENTRLRVSFTYQLSSILNLKAQTFNTELKTTNI